ncbi:MAG: hypothetical protein JW804_04245 [Sedimentisphaerales bacterium]|nr:hypothetical protein [Sedimentisphaerales bacterium]
MKSENKFWVLIALTVILILPAWLHAAEVRGEISISNNGSSLHTQFKMVLSDEGTGSGFFQYSDGESTVRIKVTCLKIDGEYAWFAGKCVEGPMDNLNNWFFGVVHDGGQPGRLVDQLWWEWISESDDAESIAKSKVENLEIPSERKVIESGDIKVSD